MNCFAVLVHGENGKESAQLEAFEGIFPNHYKRKSRGGIDAHWSLWPQFKAKEELRGLKHKRQAMGSRVIPRERRSMRRLRKHKQV